MWDHSQIGIDDTPNRVIFIRKIKDEETYIQADSAEIQQCRVLHTSREVSNEDGHYKVTDQVELALTFHGKSRQETGFSFYHFAYDHLMLKGEIQLAEKWSGLLNKAVSAKGKQIIEQ